MPFFKQTFHLFFFFLPLLLSDSGLELPPLTWGGGEDFMSFCAGEKEVDIESHFDFWTPWSSHADIRIQIRSLLYLFGGVCFACPFHDFLQALVG